jgi:hypothetical protein
MAEANVAAASGGIAGKVLTTAKMAVLSPVFGVIALGGIIAFEWWKGEKDSQKIVVCAQKEA